MNLLYWIFGLAFSSSHSYSTASCAVSQSCDTSEELENIRKRFWTDAEEDIKKQLEENKRLRLELEKFREWYEIFFPANFQPVRYT